MTSGTDKPFTADDIIAAARSVLGVKFRHQGRNPATGLDCAGLVIHVARTLGIPYLDEDHYARRPSGGLLESMLDMQPSLERIVGMPQAGDILLMRFDGDPQHLGVFTGKNLIHSYGQIRKVCEHGMTEQWAARVVRVYRFRGITP